MTSAHRQTAMSILGAALRAVDPAIAVSRYVTLSGSRLAIGDQVYDLDAIKHVYVVGCGKAGATMANATATIIGDRLDGGWINTKYGHGGAVATLRSGRRLTVFEAGHPVPDANGIAGTEQIMRIAAQVGSGDLLICLISGGGSALMVAPAPGITLEDKQAVTKLMLGCGATINELNCVRKHLSAIKGGQLARLGAPAQIATLILSDVVGNPLDVIASGPTVADSTTFDDAWALLAGYSLIDRLPQAVRRRLEAGCAGQIADTPKPGGAEFARVNNVIIGSNDLAARAAVEEAQRLGLHALLLSTYVEGEAREVARVYAGIFREMAASGQPLPRPACVVAGGETTVTLHGSGLGGRNQELALATAPKIASLPDVLVLTCGTDGTDGPTDAAGALADGGTMSRAAGRGLDPLAYLANNDSYHFFETLGDLIITGPTGTNVNDLTLLFAF